MPLPEAAINDQPRPGDDGTDMDSAPPEMQPKNEPRMLDLTEEEKDECGCQDMEDGDRYQFTGTGTAQDGKLQIDSIQQVKMKGDDAKDVPEPEDGDGLDDDRQSKMTRGPKSPSQMGIKLGSDDFQ